MFVLSGFFLLLFVSVIVKWSSDKMEISLQPDFTHALGGIYVSGHTSCVAVFKTDKYYMTINHTGDSCGTISPVEDGVCYLDHII